MNGHRGRCVCLVVIITVGQAMDYLVHSYLRRIYSPLSLIIVTCWIVSNPEVLFE